jgi:hypothetical protein
MALFMFFDCPTSHLHILLLKEEVWIMSENNKKRRRPVLPPMFEWGSTPHDHSDSVDSMLCRLGRVESCRAAERIDVDEEIQPGTDG